MEQTIDPGDKSVEKSSNHKEKKVSEANNPILDNPHHTPPKKIRTYFFEFLMLFLAVLCGFLADNWRENYQSISVKKPSSDLLLRISNQIPYSQI